MPIEHAARLLAIADGLCEIGQLRAGQRAGQFSVFNFLIRCAIDDDYPSPDERPTHVVLMQAGILRRHGWYAHFWLPRNDRPLRVAIPAPISKTWRWHDDILEISRRFETSEAWTHAIGCPVEEHVSRFLTRLGVAEIVRSG